MELFTGATGYIRGRLMRRLLGEGRAVGALAPSPERLAGGRVEAVAGDLIAGPGLREPLEGGETASSLNRTVAHGVGPKGAFAAVDRRAADNFARAAQE